MSASGHATYISLAADRPPAHANDANDSDYAYVSTSEPMVRHRRQRPRANRSYDAIVVPPPPQRTREPATPPRNPASRQERLDYAQLDAMLTCLQREVLRTRAQRDALLDLRDQALRDAASALQERDRALRELAIAKALVREHGSGVGEDGDSRDADKKAHSDDDLVAGDDMIGRRSKALQRVLGDADALHAVFP